MLARARWHHITIVATLSLCHRVQVLDCSDVVLQVLDARDVEGTRCRAVEAHLRKNAHHKHLIFVINKCDLVPNWVTRRWVKQLSAEYPTLAFHASLTNSFGKGSLINLLRQYAKLHTDRKQISVGVIGFPNVGKSSIINTLRGKKSCKTAPIPGETKVDHVRPRAAGGRRVVTARVSRLSPPSPGRSVAAPRIAARSVVSHTAHTRASFPCAHHLFTNTTVLSFSSLRL